MRKKRVISCLLAILLTASLAESGQAAFHQSPIALTQTPAEPAAEEPSEEPSEEPEEGSRREKEPPEGEQPGTTILSRSQVIAHAMGATDGIVLLNTLEGFQAQYAAGVRVFEADIRLTRDGKAVLRHDWRAGWQPGVNEVSIPTLETFLYTPVLEKYTSLSFRDLLRLMEEYPDICIITDTKYTEPEMVLMEFDAMTSEAEELGVSYLFDRIIVQVYTKNMFRLLNDAYHFPHYIYTLYNEGFAQTEAAFREKAEFCSQYGIGGITMWDSWWRSEYKAIAEEYGIRVYVHTVNDIESAKKLIASGVDAVYTDSIVPADFNVPEAIPAQGPLEVPEEAGDAGEQGN